MFMYTDGCRMEVNGLNCYFNMPTALTVERDGEGKEISQRLPPYAPQRAYLVDEYPACPKYWLRSGPDLASYFVAVKVEDNQKYGMWLDFNRNFSNAHEVAIVLSIQGINPETGQEIVDLVMERYEKNCPVHHTAFMADRYCKECGYKWPAQNYLATTGTPQGYFWIDGFRAKDGIKRQYVFTLQAMQSVAAQIIGERRAFAIGVAFFLSKEKKKQPESPSYQLIKSPSNVLFNHSSGFRSAIMSLDLEEEAVDVKAVEVGAGARITQETYRDPTDPDFWYNVPAGRIIINYILAEDAEKIITAGRLNLDAEDGYLEKVSLAV